MQKRSSVEIQNAYVKESIERGLTDGNGFTNGFATKNTPRETLVHNGDTLAQIELSTYKTGLTNGNGLTIGEGVSNGNGVSSVNGNGKPNRIPLVKAKRLRKRVFGIAVAVFLVLAPLSIYMIDLPEANDSIVIDGDFRDWEGVLRHTDSLGDMSVHPNVNIIETSFVVQDDMVSTLMVVDGWMFQGGSNGKTDQVNILLDSDADESTGYSYGGIGADYRIHAYGKDGRINGGTIYIFDEYYRSPDKRANGDWNAWNPANNGNIAISGNKLEANVFLFKDTYNSDRTMYAVFQTLDHAGFSDRTNIISTYPGHLAVDQSPAVTDDIVESTSKLQFLRLIASAHESPITIESLILDRNSDVTVSISPQLPITLRAGESRELMVSADTSTLPDESVVNIELKDVLALTSVMSEPVSVPVTISGEGYTGYIGSAPDTIVIDGAFGDWSAFSGHSDNIEDSTISGNRNIDIREYRTVESLESLSFYVRVDGKMMQGTELLTQPISVVERDLKGGSDPGLMSPKQNNPATYGQDYAYFMLDLDNNQFTGYNVNDHIGAEYMLRMVGQSGEIQTSELYQYFDDSPAMKLDGMDEIIKNRVLSNNEWIKVTDIDAACDTKRLETQVIAEYLNQNDLSNVDYYILMTDWSKAFDFAVDPYLGGLGDSGTMTITKMDETTEHLESKSSNSRNPMDTRASSRALITSGNKAGANVIPVNLDTMQGEYWNINKFEITGTVTVNVVAGSLLVIKAAHIYINGTLNGNAGGIFGGLAGTPGGGNGGPGGGLAPINGNGTGGLGNSVTGIGGDGGGGGGYGGAGGDGGAAGGAGTGGGGPGGSTHGSLTSMYIAMGRGAGGGGGGTNPALALGGGGLGGAGGAGIWLQATTNMSIVGTISADGGNGAIGNGSGINNEHGAGGGGGGSGGGILIKLDSTTNTLVINGATITANAGNGGNGGAGGGGGADGGGGGGGGGGGRIKIFFNSTFTNTSNTFQVNAGTGGTGGAGNPAGSNGLGGTAGKYYVIPEFTMIAIPVMFTMLIFMGMRRRKVIGRTRTKSGESGSTEEVIL